MPDYPVLIPYSELQELLKAPQAMAEYNTQLCMLRREIEGLRAVQQQCFDVIADLRAMLELRN